MHFEGEDLQGFLFGGGVDIGRQSPILEHKIMESEFSYYVYRRS